MLTDSGNYDFTEDGGDVGRDDITQDTVVEEVAIVRTKLLMFDTDHSRD